MKKDTYIVHLRPNAFNSDSAFTPWNVLSHIFDRTYDPKRANFLAEFQDTLPVIRSAAFDYSDRMVPDGELDLNFSVDPSFDASVILGSLFGVASALDWNISILRVRFMAENSIADFEGWSGRFLNPRDPSFFMTVKYHLSPSALLDSFSSDEVWEMLADPVSRENLFGEAIFSAIKGDNLKASFLSAFNSASTIYSAIP